MGHITVKCAIKGGKNEEKNQKWIFDSASFFFPLGDMDLSRSGASCNNERLNCAELHRNNGNGA